jgi:amino-acid N-acetyltransferase
MTGTLEPIVAAPRTARPEDLDVARRLLVAAGLPLAGVEEHFTSFRLLEVPRERIVGLAGSERYGITWLLRSLVLAPEVRGRGHGGRLVTALLDEAQRAGVADVFLLTTDAQRFFGAYGFRAVPRATAPVALRSSAELQGACPASATLMRLEVAP